MLATVKRILYNYMYSENGLSTINITCLTPFSNIISEKDNNRYS